MARKTFQIAAIITAVTLVGTLTVTATGGDSDSGKEEGGFLHHLHQMVGQHLHRGSHHQDHMAQFIEQLELTPDQQQRLERIHQSIGNLGNEGHTSMAEVHDQLVSQVEQGYLDIDEVRRLIDEHLEQMRSVAYAVTDELVPLVNELDASQRETLLTHLQGNEKGHHAAHGGQGHGHGGQGHGGHGH